MMRTSLIGAASVALVAGVCGCSDGTGQLPGTSGSGNNTPMAGTPGSGGSSGGMGNPMGGMPPTAGSSPMAGSAGGTVVPPMGGMGGASGGSGNTAGSGGGGTDPYSGPFKVLVVSQALDFPHDSIPICNLMMGIESLRSQVEQDRGKAQPPNLGVTPDAEMPAGTKPGSQFTSELASNDLSQFTDENLAQYGLVFFCNPTGTVFSANPSANNGQAAMAAFQKFVENGGAWAGVHSATDFEKTNGFPWFTNTLVGAYFDHHDPDRTSGTVQAQSEFLDHPVLTGIPVTWSTQDEWYYMNRDVSSQPGFNVLSKLVSDMRPVAWVKELGLGGRSFYTIRGHNKSVFEEPDFRKLVLNGILWATHRLE